MGAAQRTAAIAGASVAGLSSACALAQAGWRPTVLERRPDLGEGGRAILLQPNGLAALERLGALNGVRERGYELTRVVFYGRDFRPLAVTDYRELSHPHPYAVEIRPADLREALAERLSELGAEAPRHDSEVTGVAWEGGRVSGLRCGDGFAAADLVVGADGPASTVRAGLGIGCRSIGGPARYVLGVIEGVSRGPELAVYCGPGYADGVVPLRDGVYFWDAVTGENAAAVDSRDVDGWRAVFARRLPTGDRLPAAVTSWSQLTTIAVEPFWAARRVAGGAALAGDAAGAVHPHAAQGANLALEDAVALADRAGGGLEHYGRERQRKLRRYVLWSRLAASNLDAPNLPWRANRRLTFASNAVAPVRRQLLRAQAGLR